MVEPDTDPPVPTGGRPGVELAQARTAVDTWIARTGRLPSTRELRTALGDTGSLSTLGRHLQSIRAERLIDGETAEHGSAEDIALKAMKEALKVLAADAAEAAEAMVTAAERTADERVNAAASLQARAEAHAAKVEQEREHALGQVAELHERVRELQQGLADAREALTAGRQRESAFGETVNELEHTLGSLRTERDRLAEDRQALTGERDELRFELGSLQQTQHDTNTALAEQRSLLAAEQANGQRLAARGTELAALLDKRQAALIELQTLNEREQASLDAAQKALSALRSTNALLEQRAVMAETERDRLVAERETRWNRLLERFPDQGKESGADPSE